jgi:hypothetical protein
MDAPSVPASDPAAEGEPVLETLVGALPGRVAFEGDLVLPIGESVELSAEGQRQLVKLLQAPPAPTEAMIALRGQARMKSVG